MKKSNSLSRLWASLHLKCCAGIVFLMLFVCLPLCAYAEVRVVATLSTLGAIVKEVGGPLVQVETMALPTQDPHFVDPRPDYILKLSRADLLVYNGLELEIGWLPPVQKGARNNKVLDGGSGALDASQFIQPMNVPKQKVDRSQGDIHALGNPHYLYSLPCVVRVAKGVADKLAALDPANAATYQSRYESFKARADQMIEKARVRFSDKSGAQKRIVAYHDSMVYLFDWLGLEQMATVEAKPGIAPSPSQISALITKMRAEKPEWIVQEVWQPRSASQKIAEMTGAKLVILPVFPDKDEALLAFFERMLAVF
ncbi:MAG: zinc ABC transporter substrate-binding protein [Proteobacteria bacterium]|nr:zinc ABC transporter substrate-binding protein [Pseudomonadota bacterium]